jgi:hypothetical protein
MSIKRARGSLLQNNDMRTFGLDTPQSIAALEWLQDLVHKERIAPQGTEARWRIQAGNVDTLITKGAMASVASQALRSAI